MTFLALPLAFCGRAWGAPGSLVEGKDVAAISKVTIEASHMGWGSVKANLRLVRSNSLFRGSGHRVPEGVVSNLLAAMREPARTSIDPVDLGLTPMWLEENRDALLNAFGGETKEVFPLASPRQRAWLTNALLDLNLLSEVVRDSRMRFWTDDYPDMKIGFYHGNREVARLHSEAQISFMLPWEVTWGTHQHTTYHAGISRSVAALLPSGFLHRERIQGNLFAILKEGFANHCRVGETIEQMTLEETLGTQTNRLFGEYILKRHWMPSGSYGRFPDTWMATLHRTNWPERLLMPVHWHVEQGVVRQLPRVLDSADARVQPILRSSWLMGLVQGAGTATIEVAPEGSMADDPYLRSHMAKVGLGEFYDQVKPLMEQGLALTFRERIGSTSRTSEWIVLPEGTLLLVKFAGDGVLDWSPQELGYRGHQRQLDSVSYNMVGVFLTPQGRIEKVVPQARNRQKD